MGERASGERDVERKDMRGRRAVSPTASFEGRVERPARLPRTLALSAQASGGRRAERSGGYAQREWGGE